MIERIVLRQYRSCTEASDQSDNDIQQVDLLE